MGRSTRRHILLGAISALAGLADARGGLSHCQAAERKVYVFAVTSIRPHVLQQMLETALVGISVTAFGRVGDFSRALEEAPPDAAIASSAVLTALGQRADIQGEKGSSSHEDYLVVSEHPVRPDALADVTVGCLDLVGRKGLPALVASLLGTAREPDVQRVTKTEDLLQLLQFKRAEVILVPERFLADLQGRTKMELKILRLPSAKLPRVGIAFPGNRQAVEGPVRALPAPVLEQLGVDRWR